MESTAPRQRTAAEEFADLAAFRPDHRASCDVCGQAPTVSATGLCGPCTWGEADTIGGGWWGKDDEKRYQTLLSIVEGRVVDSTARGPEKTGTVKWFDKHKGFGFIVPEEGGEDVFLHNTIVLESGIQDLRDGQKVRYEPRVSDRTGKTRAKSVALVGAEK